VIDFEKEISIKIEKNKAKLFKKKINYDDENFDEILSQNINSNSIYFNSQYCETDCINFINISQRENDEIMKNNCELLNKKRNRNNYDMFNRINNMNEFVNGIEQTGFDNFYRNAEEIDNRVNFSMDLGYLDSQNTLYNKNQQEKFEIINSIDVDYHLKRKLTFDDLDKNVSNIDKSNVLLFYIHLSFF